MDPRLILRLEATQMSHLLPHSATLRTVGRLFDVDGAHTVEIEEAPHDVALAWRAGDGAMKKARYPWPELDRLQRTNIQGAQAARRADLILSSRGWTELLRTLGQDLDEENADTTSITGDLTALT